MTTRRRRSSTRSSETSVSSGHCANIMNPSYRALGVGYSLVEGSPATHYWTQNFGRPQG